MDEQYVRSAIDRAAQLINSEEFNILVEQKSSGFRKKNGKRGSQGGGSDLAAFEAAAGFGGASKRRSTNDDMPNVNMDEIRESFKKTPAMSGGMGMASVPKSFTETSQRTMIQEQTQYAPQPQYQPMQQSIDYNYLKYIINECIKENLNKLNESANLSSLKMAGGNKIQFVDSKGNVYEGVLKRVQ